MDKYEKYLREQIIYWEQLREDAMNGKPNLADHPLDFEYWKGYHDKYSFAAQVLLSALWEYKGEYLPTMKEIMRDVYLERNQIG